jgi:hypothetical protein
MNQGSRSRIPGILPDLKLLQEEDGPGFRYIPDAGTPSS